MRVKQSFIHGFVLLIASSIALLALESSLIGFMVYNPPIGLGLFVLVSLVVVPLLLGALNVLVLHWLYGFKGWQTEFWLNGVLILLVFAAVNLVLLTGANVRFSAWVALVEVLFLSVPFGLLGRVTNGGCEISADSEEL